MLNQFAEQMAQWPSSKRYWIGFSGGLDSTVLLHLALRWQNHIKYSADSKPAVFEQPLFEQQSSTRAHSQTQNIPIGICHINHGLQANAIAWADHAKRVADRYKIECRIIDVDINNQVAGTGVEAAARTARYQAWQALVEFDEAILLAHHANDQAETVLFRWLRGSGVKGLAGMPSRRLLQRERLNQMSAEEPNIGKNDKVNRPGSKLGSESVNPVNQVGQAPWIGRPLLPMTRSQLESYAQKHQLEWIEDPTNNQSDFDRNFLRNQVFPKITERWPKAVENINRSAVLHADAAVLLQDLAGLDLGMCFTQHANVLASDYEQTSSDQTSSDQTNELLAIKPHIHWHCIKKLSLSRQRNALHAWLSALPRVTLPSLKKIDEIIAQCNQSKNDAEIKLTWPGGQIRFYRGVCYAGSPADFGVAAADINAGLISWGSLNWDSFNANPFDERVFNVDSFKESTNNSNQLLKLDLPNQLGALQINQMLSIAPQQQLDILSQLTVRFRQGGERIKINGKTQQLKKCLNAMGVLPWWRSCVPLIFEHDECVGMAGLRNGDRLLQLCQRVVSSDQFAKLLENHTVPIIEWVRPVDIIAVDSSSEV